ncbi:MAG: glucosaminidase domain-containing protein [Flavobacteriales bacterium]
MKEMKFHSMGIRLNSLLVLFGLFSLGDASAQKRLTPHDYVSRWSEVAVQQMVEHSIPASITLAQGILESGNGNSELAAKSNNHFGIKCHSDWDGRRTYHDDDEKGECFRVYKSAAASFDDHSDFLKRSRYAPLFELDITDYKGWARGLKKCGYATNPKYAGLLINLIERYELQRFDEEGLTLMDRIEDISRVQEDLAATRLHWTAGREVWISDNDIRYLIAGPQDSYETLAKELDMMPGQLYRYNEIPRKSEEHQLVGGEIVYLQPKRNVGNVDWVTVKAGQTLYQISQEHGIKLRTIIRKNRMRAGHSLQAGDRLSLHWQLNRDGELPWHARLIGAKD